MVLPRGKAIPITGKAPSQEVLQITIHDQVHEVSVNAQGDWSVVLNPLPAGGPFELSFIGKDTLILDNILVGDLWLCAGQSNMQYTLQMLGYKEQDTVRADMPNLRLFTVGLDLDYLPKKEIKSGQWQVATAESAHNFSATSYFFGRYLVETQGVPIGLISSNLGATSIETWMSIDALKQFPQFDEVTSDIIKTNKDFATINRELEAFRKTWDKDHYLRGPGFEGKWFEDDYDDSDWETCNVPIFWEYIGYEDHDGSFWFRREFDLDSNQLKQDLHLSLNQIDDYDITWVNGHQVGESFGNSNFRSYTVPKDILRAKKNTLTIRVFDIGGLGGIYTNAFWGNAILNGQWKYKKGRAIDAATFPIPKVANGSLFSHPSLLYNGNIAPLHKLPIAGAIWYQGESNENRAVEYGSLLKAMIKDWRNKWKDEQLPFFIVQLANYRQENPKPENSRWAEVRESQMKATELPNVDIVTAIDIGDAHDIHPYNKMEVGRRLGLLAMHYVYGAALQKGPVYLNHRIEDNQIIVKMNTYGSPLKSLDKYGYVRGFAIAGADGQFEWAKAFLKGKDEVVVYSDKIASPKYVRYAWSDNPGPLDLVNEAALPAFPFRTDTLELSTAKEKFKFNPHAF